MNVMVRVMDFGVRKSVPCRRSTFVAACIAVIALSALAAPPVSAQIASEADIRAGIEERFNSGENLSLPVERVRQILTIHYLDKQGPMLWVGTPRLEQLIDRLTNADADGLKPKDYPADYLVQLRDAADLSDPEHTAFTEMMFSAFFLVYAADMKVGRFVPNKIDPDLFLERRTVDGPAVLAKAASIPDLDQFFAAWEPQRREYRALKALLAHYRDLEAAGGWPSVEPGDVLKPGMTDPRVAQVKARLAASGDYSPGSADPQEFDDALVEAVKRFQKRHGLDADGVIGKQSLFALNIKVEDRVRQIVVNMERWRWRPENLGRDYIKVNIAGFELTRVQKEKVVRRMDVVVGKTYHRTPAFSDKIRYLEFNPTWTVPFSIATKEMLPELKANPASYADKGFDLFERGSLVSWQGIDWSQYSKKELSLCVPPAARTDQCARPGQVHVPEPAQCLSARYSGPFALRQELPGTQPRLRPSERADQICRRGALGYARLVTDKDR